MDYARNFDMINSKFKEMFFPTLLASVAGNFVVIADAFIIGILMNPMYLSVIQCMGPFEAFVNMIYWLIGFGGTILSTAARAEFKQEKSNRIFTVSLIGILLISGFLCALGFIFTDQFVNILCNSSQLKPFVMEYFRLFNIGVPFLCLMIVLAYFIRTDDFIQLQFRVFLLSNGLNVILDVVFIKYFNLGIAGAGLASSVGYIVGTIYILTYFLNSRRNLKIVKVKFNQAVKYMGEICKAGFGSASIQLYKSLKLLLLNIIIFSILGEVGLAAYNMCNNCLFLVIIFVLGVSHSLLPIVAVYYNEQDYKGVNYVAKMSLKLVIVFGSFFMILFLVYPQMALHIFSVKDPSQIPVIMNAIRLFSLSMLGFSITYLYTFYAQSVQNTKMANSVTLLEGLILPVGLAYLFSRILGADGVWISFAVAEILTILFIFAYSKYVSKKTDGEYSGFLLNKKVKEEIAEEFTLEGNIGDAVGLSQKVQESIEDSRMSVFVSLAIEEIITYVIGINDKKLDWIDLIIRNRDDSIIISLKHAGIGFNPEYSDIESDNIRILTNISENIDYSQILGLNNTVITIKK